MIKFLRYKWLYLLISASILLPGFYSLFRWGVNSSIDFTGGTLFELKFESPKSPSTPLRAGAVESQKLKEIVEEKKVEVGSIQSSGTSTYLLRMKPIDKEKKEEILRVLEEEFGQVDEVRFETVGPTLGKELLRKTLYAAGLSVIGILLFIGWSFKNWHFGVAAVLALLHDFFVLLGIFSLLGHFLGIEVDSLFVTAALTTMSFSVHDTIVIFDRIREKKRLNPELSLESQVNIALTETMVRSLNNSFTIVFMLLSLILLGGETIRWFIIALLIGTLAGTYSSPFVATPILVVLQKIKKR
ncbi:protein translocase subunit SecF [Candidatus Microgenomates bacterium]|nr:protein translocase subunit SecF [Candidatus Microgenomates bacterium]